MDDIYREVTFLQILLKRSVIVACLFEKQETMLKRPVGTNTFNQGSEALSRLLEGKGGAIFKVLVTFQQGF